MQLFQKIYNPRRLTLKEIWQVYNILGERAFQGQYDYLVDEVEDVLNHADDYAFTGSLEIMYGRRITYKTPIEYLLAFIRGAKKNKLLGFADFIRKLK